MRRTVERSPSAPTSTSPVAVLPSVNRACTPSGPVEASASRLPYSTVTPRRTASSRNSAYSAARRTVFAVVPSATEPPMLKPASVRPPLIDSSIRGVSKPTSRTRVCSSSSRSAAIPFGARLRKAPTPSAVLSYASYTVGFRPARWAAMAVTVPAMPPPMTRSSVEVML